MFRPFKSPLFPPIRTTHTPQKNCNATSSLSRSSPALPLNVEIPKRKRQCYTLETKQQVYVAVKEKGLKYADAAVRFHIMGGKSAVQNIVKGGPYDHFHGMKRMRVVPSIMIRLEDQIFEDAIHIRNNKFPVSRMVN